MNDLLPTIALAMGDPAGISPELTAKVMALSEVRAAARFIVIGDRRLFAAGARTAGLSSDIATVGSFEEALRSSDGPVFVDMGNCDPDRIAVGKVSRDGGASAVANFRAGIDLAAAGKVDVLCFTPFNKGAMRLAANRQSMTDVCEGGVGVLHWRPRLLRLDDLRHRTAGGGGVRSGVSGVTKGNWGWTSGPYKAKPSVMSAQAHEPRGEWWSSQPPGPLRRSYRR